MSKRNGGAAATAAAPEPEPAAPAEPRAIPVQHDHPPGLLHVQLDGGKWVDMTRELDGEDWALLYRLDALDPSDRRNLLDLYGPIMIVLEKHTVAHNLGGPILRRDSGTLMQIWRGWNDAAEAATLDPAPADA